MRSSAPNFSPRFRTDRFLVAGSRFCVILSASIVFFIVVFVLAAAWPALTRIEPTRFFTDPGWHPTSGEFNLTPMLAGTLLSTVGAILIAAPLGVASAVFSQFYAPSLVARWHRRLVELLAGIPSVVYGLWGLVVLAPIIARMGGSGQSLLTAILVLSLMILPTVALTADASLNAVPTAYLQGAAALGLNRWSTVRQVAIPAARNGIFIGLILATGRALGETMAVLMVAGNVVRMPHTVFDPVRTLTANIALEMGYATQSHRSVLFVSGLVLMIVVAGLVAMTSRRVQGDNHG